MSVLDCRWSGLQISGGLGIAVLINLSLYMGPVSRQVEYHQAIQSIRLSRGRPLRRGKNDGPQLVSELQQCMS
jgi:hypothetical protein